MRELPEPDLGFAHKSYSPELVLAIQRQAYENGLRDAATLDNFAVAGIAAYKLISARNDLSAREVASFCFQFAKAMMAEREKAMLTASQKEQK